MKLNTLKDWSFLKRLRNLRSIRTLDLSDKGQLSFHYDPKSDFLINFRAKEDILIPPLSLGAVAVDRAISLAEDTVLMMFVNSSEMDSECPLVIVNPTIMSINWSTPILWIANASNESCAIAEGSYPFSGILIPVAKISIQNRG